jgi:eukaryotic-like serine/threonine-protein kinase
VVSDSSVTTRPRARPEPERIGRYLLFEPLASGGMARVHLGRLVGPVGFSRMVAIKRLHSHLAAEGEFVAMFLDEARLAARVQHPNVVAILDVVSQPDELFIVLEYVPGESLSALNRAQVDAGQCIPTEIAISVMVGALTGLHAAHEAKSETGAPLGIVHRDVSPQNIIVGADGLARVLDFGIAYAAERLQMTRAGQIKGKPEYMSAEQLTGGVVDRRTDVYAAGVVLWELLAGQRLFRGKSDAETFKLVNKGTREPPSSLNPKVPRALDDIVMRSLALDPALRYPTAGEFAFALEQTVPMGSQRAVAEWVEQTAGNVLQERARRVASIESQEYGPDGETITTEPSPDATRSSTEHVSINPPELVPAGASRVTGDMSAMRAASSEGSSSRVWLALAGSLLGAVLFCGLLLVVLAARRDRPGEAPPTVEAAPMPAAIATVLAAPAASPASSAEATAVPSADGATSPPAKARGKPTVGTPRADPCKERFRWDHGVKIPKPECF